MARLPLLLIPLLAAAALIGSERGSALAGGAACWEASPI
jgi:hypothetical protein